MENILGYAFLVDHLAHINAQGYSPWAFFFHRGVMEPTQPSVPLKDLFQEFPLPVYSSIPEVEISGIAIDSRRVQQGDLFVALIGEMVDGHRYIHDAIENGAVAVIGERFLTRVGKPYVQVANSRHALTYLAAGYYHFPAQKMVVIGVTGTDGKTTTVNLIFQILKSAGLPVGMISTVNAVIGDELVDTGFHVTTPDAHDVQRYLAHMVSAGLTHVVLETTSHGLAQHRVDACEFDLGVVTNITHEHLDQHGTYEAYRATKGRLLSLLSHSREKQMPVARGAILNRDDASYTYLANLAQVPIITYGLDESADVRALDIDTSPDGIRFTAQGRGFQMSVQSNLLGRFNVSNCLAAIAATVSALRIDPELAKAGIAKLEGVPGRMESIDLGQDFTAIVDFAHTPNALRCALQTAREIIAEKGRLITVFGSAGLRDREKRRMMPEVSIQMADFTILTAEDPRTESLDAILEDMAMAAKTQGGVEGSTFWRIADRGQAIRAAVKMACPGDLIIVCGKGHEQSMCFGTTEYAWDDRQALRSILATHLGLAGPKLPYLPTQDGKMDL